METGLALPASARAQVLSSTARPGSEIETELLLLERIWGPISVKNSGGWSFESKSVAINGEAPFGRSSSIPGKM